MITKSKLKLIKSLSRKKYREEHQLFVVEGYKSIRELINSGIYTEVLLVTEGNHKLDDFDPDVISVKEMNNISNYTTAPGYLAVFKMIPKTETPDKGKILVLDDVKDPGNLGTIIRLADWFNIQHIICSEETVDMYNTKCVQASMASLSRVQIHYTELATFLNNTSLPIFVTAMDGKNVYETTLPQDAIIIMGNESHGISNEIQKLGKAISIPQYGTIQKTESLNVATATSLILGEWLRTTTITEK